MNFLYPYKEEGKMKLKFTVSELKKRESLREEAGEELIQEPEMCHCFHISWKNRMKD